MTRQIEYLVSDDTRFSFLIRVDGQPDRWTSDPMQATRFDEDGARAARNSSRRAYAMVPLIGITFVGTGA